MGRIKVSVAIITYNHEHYIEQAIRSVLEQNVPFSYELIIGDDASKDKTPDIIKKIYEEYPDIIVPILREKNIGMAKNSMDVISKCKGEYIAFLEGDDYWIDRKKLNKQVNFLDAHKDYSAYYHNARVINGKDQVLYERKEGYCIAREYTVDEIQNFILPGQTSTLMSRNFYTEKEIDLSVVEGIKYTPLDRLLPIILLKFGKIYCDEATMSVYRYVLDGSSSWSSRNELQKCFNYFIYFKNLVEMQQIGEKLGFQFDFKEKKAFFYGEALYASLLRGKVVCIFMCMLMIASTNKKLHLLFRGNRLFIRKIKWKIKYKIKKLGFNS